MEGVIEKLLADFEDGRLTRRQLIRTLAVVAVAGPAAASAETPTAVRAPASPVPWRTTWIDHISYQVTEYRKSVEFYTSTLGWEVESDTGTHQATLRMGDAGGIIIRNRYEPGAASARSFVDHISFGIEPWDTEAVRAELERRGLDPRPDMAGDGFKSFHVLDPDGFDLQISNRTRGSAPSARGRLRR